MVIGPQRKTGFSYHAKQPPGCPRGCPGALRLEAEGTLAHKHTHVALLKSLGAAHPSYPAALPHTPVGRLLVGPLQVVLAAQVALHLHAVPVVHLGRQRCRLITLAQRRVQGLKEGLCGGPLICAGFLLLPFLVRPWRQWRLQVLGPLPLFFPLLRGIWEEHTLLGVQSQGWLLSAELGGQQAPPESGSSLLCPSWPTLALPQPAVGFHLACFPRLCPCLWLHSHSPPLQSNIGAEVLRVS